MSDEDTQVGEIKPIAPQQGQQAHQAGYPVPPGQGGQQQGYGAGAGTGPGQPGYPYPSAPGQNPHYQPTGYPGQSGYPPHGPWPGGHPQQTGYPPQQPYPQQQAGYPQQQAGYPPQQQPYPQQGTFPQQGAYPASAQGQAPTLPGKAPSAGKRPRASARPGARGPAAAKRPTPAARTKPAQGGYDPDDEVVLVEHPSSSSNPTVPIIIVVVAIALLATLIAIGTSGGSADDQGDGQLGLTPEDQEKAQKLGMAPVMEDSKLKQAHNSGVDAIMNKMRPLTQVEGDKALEVTRAGPSELDRFVEEILAADHKVKYARQEPKPVEWNPGANAHKAQAGDPIITERFTLKSTSPWLDLEYLVIRVYRSELERNKAFDELKGHHGRTQIVRTGAYAISQWTENLRGDALAAIPKMREAYIEGFLKVVPRYVHEETDIGFGLQ